MKSKGAGRLFSPSQIHDLDRLSSKAISNYCDRYLHQGEWNYRSWASHYSNKDDWTTSQQWRELARNTLAANSPVIRAVETLLYEGLIDEAMSHALEIAQSCLNNEHLPNFEGCERVLAFLPPDHPARKMLFGENYSLELDRHFRSSELPCWPPEKKVLVMK